MRLARPILLALLLLALAPIAAHAQPDQRCFPETGQCIAGPIRAYWERNGGLAVFGFPITAQAAESVEGTPLQVQWFERDRLEIQPNGTVTAGRLGVERLEQLGTPWQQGSGAAAGPGCTAFPETGHQVCGAFAAYWRANGGLERFGFPVTGEFTAELEGRPYTVQYFERRRFELHPELAPDAVLLGLLGREVLTARQGQPQPVPPAPQPTPAPQPPPSSGITRTCAQNAPAPAEGAQAWMTVPEPGRRSDNTLCVRLVVNGQPVAGAGVEAEVNYKSTKATLDTATTGADGVAQLTFNIGGASSGYTVRVDVTVTVNGQTYTTNTSFTPRY